MYLQSEIEKPFTKMILEVGMVIYEVLLANTLGRAAIHLYSLIQ